MPTQLWRCPKCRRPFKHKNQAHSCVMIDVDTHLDAKPPMVREIYDKLWSRVKAFGDVKVSVTRSSIMFVSKSTFVAVKPKQNWLDIEFLLDKEVKEFPIHKAFRANKSRVAHFVRLESAKDVSTKLISWLKASYELTRNA